MLTLGGRTRLTQQQLAERLGVSTRTIQYWETGVGRPAGANLRHLIEIYLDQGAFTRGAEGSEERAVWDSAAFETPRLAAPFDAIWFRAAAHPPHAGSTSAGRGQFRSPPGGLDPI
jgi:transcriptional regulator with XRE-family HTH domain